MKDLLKEVLHELEGPVGPHLQDEELIAYLREPLDAEDRERIEKHLVYCAACREEFLSVRAFFEPAEAEEPTVSPQEIARGWHEFWQRVAGLGAAEAAQPTPGKFRFLGRGLPGLGKFSWLEFALAAGLLVAVGVAGLWTVRLERQQQHLVSSLQQEQQRTRALEQENERLKEQLERQREEQERALQRLDESWRARHETEIARLREPDLNLPLYDLFSQEALVRAGRTDAINRITIPPTARRFGVILNGEGQPDYPHYELEIVDRRGHVVWKGRGLRRDRYGNFVLALDRTFLKPGEYRLHLFGRQQGQRSRIAQYILLLE